MRSIENHSNIREVTVSESLDCEVCDYTIDDVKKLKHKKKNLRSRTFAYEMNENKAKTKLLKGARRAEHLDIELKSTCANLRFDDGAFQEIALPLIKQFHNQINTMFRFMGHDIRVTESDAGVDNLDKHIDTKLVLFVNEERIVVHVYNTTQNVFVKGKSFANLVANCLQPYFTNYGILEDAFMFTTFSYTKEE